MNSKFLIASDQLFQMRSIVFHIRAHNSCLTSNVALQRSTLRFFTSVCPHTSHFKGQSSVSHFFFYRRATWNLAMYSSSFPVISQIITILQLRDGTGAKHTCWFSREPGFRTQQPHGGSNSRGYSVLFCPLRVPGKHVVCLHTFS